MRHAFTKVFAVFPIPYLILGKDRLRLDKEAHVVGAGDVVLVKESHHTRHLQRL